MTNDTRDQPAPPADPTTTYAEWCAADRRLRQILDRPTEPEEAREAKLDESRAVVERMSEGPDADLFRCVWCVDNWQVVSDPDDTFAPFGDVIRINGEDHEAAEVAIVARTLLAELRRLRPELAPPD